MDNESDVDRFYGKYRGIVVKNQPDKLGRIQVIVSTVMRNGPMWAMPCVPYAGAGVGFVFLPEEGTNVWVEFEDGDPSYPIWTGCFWKETELEPIAAGPEIKLIKTEKVTIEIDDKRGSITIKNKSGAMIEIHGNKITAKAGAEIITQVKTMKTKLDATKFDVHDGAISVT